MSLETSLLSVGTHQVPGQTIVFCNGILNDKESALESAKTLSSILSDQKIVVYHNPTTLSHYLKPNENDSEFQLDLAKGLAKLIHESILMSQEKGIEKENISVTLFAHSHGAVVAKQALEELEAFDETAKSHVNVHAFGGATLIPTALANKVHNYVFNHDLISHIGNAWEPTSHSLYRVKTIAILMKNENIDSQTAIAKQVAKEVLLFDEKGASDSSMEETYEKKVAQYTALLNEYPIKVIQGTAFSKPTFDSFEDVANQGTLAKVKGVATNLFKWALACGSYVLTNHGFSDYARQIGQEIQV